MIEPRTPPHDTQAEQALLGSLMIGGNEAVDEIRALFPVAKGEWRAGHPAFYAPAHGLIYGAILELQASGTPTDLVTLTNQLKTAGEMEALGGTIGEEAGGGAWYITKLFSTVPTSANIAYYAEIVRDKWILRQMIDAATETIRRCHEDAEDVALLLNDTQGRFIEIGQDMSTAEALQPIGSVVDEVVDMIETTYHQRGKPIGLPSGFVDLDRMTGGFQKGKSYYFPSRPAMGKSSLGTQFAEHIAVDLLEERVPVAIWSVEMTRQELAEVIVCRRAGVNLVRLRDGFFSEELYAAVLKQAEALKDAPIYIDDKAGLSIMDFRARARRAVTKFGARLLIIDYIQRMKSTSKRAQGNRELEISEIAMGISETAKELQVPIIVLAQLNRGVEDRKDAIPELSDIRESGSMEQEAHFVGFIYRPSYYAKNLGHAAQMARRFKIEVPDDADEQQDPKAEWVQKFNQLAQIIVGKQRRGPVGTVNVRFIREFARFESEDPERPLYSNREEERQRK